MFQAEFSGESLDAIPMGAFIVDRDGVVRQHNRRAEEIWGRAPRPGQRLTAAARVFAADGQPIDPDNAPLQQLLRDGQPRRDIELVLERADGSRVSILANLGPLRDSSGALVGAITCFQDITGRKRAEQAVRDSEQHFRDVADAAPVVLWTTDASGACTFLSRGWELLTGQPVNQGLGLGWIDALHPDDQPAARQEFLSALPERRPFRCDYRFRRRDGSYGWAIDAGQPRFSAAGEFLGYAGTVTDIAQRKAAEHALRASEARYRTLAEAMPQLVWTCTPQGGCDYVSDQYCQYTGLARESLLGDAWYGVIHPEDRAGVAEAWGAAVRRSGGYDIEFRIRGRDGAYRWFMTRARPEHDGHGDVVRWLGTSTDIHDHKRLQAELRDAKLLAEAASAAKDRFLATLSHELRTPLTPVLMSASALERDSSLPEPVREEMGLIRRNVELEARLIDDLLDLTRVSRGKLELHREPCDVHALLLEAVHTCCASEINNKRLELVTELRATRHHASADPARLQQVFWNLLKNAVKFTPSGGRVTIATDDVDSTDGDGAADASRTLRITIADTGVGIETALLPRIFDAFEQGGRQVTRSFGGLGLGLAISKALVDLHDGTLTAHSDGPGSGATFAITLASIPAPARQGQDDGQPAPRRGLRILLVEDHETTARVLARLLKDSSFDVRTAHTLADARAALDGHPGEHFDLLISDLGLPDGSGLDLMRELSARNCDGRAVQGIALSGYGMEEDIRRSREVGFTAHLTKPVDFRKLQAAINQVAGK